LSDLTDNHSSSGRTARSFDWGPPVSSAGDGIKEWLVYVLVVILLCSVAWVLLDINGKREQISDDNRQISSEKNEETAKPAQPQPENIPASKADSKFFVQLGAFADEASAREVFAQMTAEGFAPTLAAPDENYELFRIFVGPFNSAYEAEEKAQRLNELEFHCFVIESL